MDKKSLFFGILIAVIGLCMIFMPSLWIDIIVILLAIEAVANGLYSLIYTRKLYPDSVFQYAVFGRGMFSIVIGLLSFLLPILLHQQHDVVVKVVIRIFAVYLIISTLLELFASAKLRDTGVDRKQFVIESIISIIAAVVLFVIAAKVGSIVVRIIGIGAVLIGAMFIFFSWKNRPLVQEPVEVVDDISGEMEKSNDIK